MNAADGEVFWRGRVGGNFSASPVAVGGTIINVSIDGDIVVLADGDTFEEIAESLAFLEQSRGRIRLGRTPLGEPCRSTPAVAAGRMFIRSVGRLHALDPVADGR